MPHRSDSDRRSRLSGRTLARSKRTMSASTDAQGAPSVRDAGSAQPWPEGLDRTWSAPSSGWVLRATVWFAAASMLTTILHELAHATTAFASGVRSTLFGYFVDLDFTDLQRTSNLPAIIGVAGPTFCLVFGIVSWWAFRRQRGSAAELPLLYLSAFGLATFFGNLMSMSMVGDFSRAAIELDLPMAVRYAGTAIGAFAVASIHFWLGRQLVHWVPANVGRTSGVLGIVALPVLLGTAAVILANQPMPSAFLGARVGEATFSLFTVIGAWTTRRDSWHGRGLLALQWTDGVAAILVVLLVRLMVRGIPLAP